MTIILRTRRTLRSAGLVALAATTALALAACGSGGARDTAGEVSGLAAHTKGAAPLAAVLPASAKAPVREVELADGSTARVRKRGEARYTAELVSRGSVFATMEAKGEDAGLDANDMFVVLTRGGEVHSWRGGGHQGPGTFTLPGGWRAEVTKAGGGNHHRARLYGHDGLAATLDAHGRDAGLDANASYIVLSPGGVISGHL